jgi:hypothetical protein
MLLYYRRDLSPTAATAGECTAQLVWGVITSAPLWQRMSVGQYCCASWADGGSDE